MSQGAPEIHAFEFQPRRGRKETPVSADVAAFRRKVRAAETRRLLRCERTRGQQARAAVSVFGWLELHPELTGRRLSSKSESPCSPTLRGVRGGI